MRRLLLLSITIIITISVNAQYGQIPNGGFENWQQDFIFENPNSWRSSNTDQFNGNANITKSTDASDGAFSARLEVSAVGTDTTNGYIYLGNIGNSGPDAGVPYTDNFEAFNISFKSNLQAGDTLNLMMIRYLGGIPVDFQVKPIAFGTYSSWTNQIIFVGNASQDSLFIGFIIGDVNGAYTSTPNSWAQVDNIQLLSGGATTTPLPNNSFENWSNTTTENPTSWFTINYILNGFNAENVIKTTDANTGSFAAELSTIQYGTDTIGGILSLGAIDFSNASIPFASSPYTAVPTTLSGSYKYQPANGDIASLQLIFYQGGVPIGSHFETFNSQSTYTNFSSNITVVGSPDSLLFIAFSGDNPGSVLKLDDLLFNGGNVSLEELLSIDFDIYPNPATNNVSIKLPNSAKHSVVIQDMSGRILYNLENASGIQSIDVSNFDKGTYMVVVSNAKVNEIKKLILQ